MCGLLQAVPCEITLQDGQHVAKHPLPETERDPLVFSLIDIGGFSKHGLWEEVVASAHADVGSPCASGRFSRDITAGVACSDDQDALISKFLRASIVYGVPLEAIKCTGNLGPVRRQCIPDAQTTLR